MKNGLNMNHHQRVRGAKVCKSFRMNHNSRNRFNDDNFQHLSHLNQLEAVNYQSQHKILLSNQPKILNCRERQHFKRSYSLIILMGVLVNYITSLDLLMTQELNPPVTINNTMTTVNNLQAPLEQLQQQQPPPSQLFLPPINHRLQPVTLVNAFHQKRSEEEEEGFIMQASSSSSSSSSSVAPQQQNATTEQQASTTTQQESATSTFINDDDDDDNQTQPDQRMATHNEESTSEGGETGSGNEDQKIPIDVNRQQFVTHDQLLNASTKDESIYLSPGSGGNNEEDIMNKSNTENSHSAAAAAQQQRVPTSRSGSLSKVSHVSSFLTGKFRIVFFQREALKFIIDIMDRKFSHRKGSQGQTKRPLPLAGSVFMNTSSSALDLLSSSSYLQT